MNRGFRSPVKGMISCLVAGAILLIATGNLVAQGVYATLTGVVSDPTQAVITGAKVTLTDDQSGSKRETVTNSDGYFTFASVPVGSYSLSIEAKGFELYKVSGIALSGAEKRNVNATLKIGSTSQSVEITGAAEAIAVD